MKHLIFLALALSACAADEVCDPTGTYSISVNWDAPTATNCGIAGIEEASFEVTEGASGLYVIDPGPADYVEGDVYDQDGDCVLRFEVGTSGVDEAGFPFTSVLSFNLRASDDDVTGSGSLTVDWGAQGTCAQGFDVDGHVFR